MKTVNAAALVALVVVFAAVAAVALPFDPVHEAADADPEGEAAPASLPEDTGEEDNSGMILGIGLVSVVAALLVIRFWTIKVE